MTEIISRLETLSRGNQFVAGALSLYGLGVLTYMLRDVPKSIYRFCLKHLTSTMYISSTHEIYYQFMDWLAAENITHKVRTVKLSNGRWGWSDKLTKGVGYGEHIVRIRGIPVKIHLYKEENKGDSVVDTLCLTVPLRNYKLFNTIIQEATSMESEEPRTKIYQWNGKQWEHSKSQRVRTFDTVYVDEEVLVKLLSALDSFKNRETWYVEKGIPYRMGILLHGHPGTGKTSVIKAVAAYMKYNLCILPVSAIFLDIEDAVDKLPDKSILVMEDIDCTRAVKDRDLLNMPMDVAAKTASPSHIDAVAAPSESKHISEAQLEQLKKLLSAPDGGLSSILNAIDGVSDSFGRILIMTTNMPKILDKALTRPGRVDLNLEVGWVTESMLRRFLGNFFPDFKIPAALPDLKKDLTVAVLQQKVMEGYTAEDIINFSKGE